MRTSTRHLFFLAASAFVLTGANVRVKRLDGGTDSGTNTNSSGNDGGAQSGGVIRENKGNDRGGRSEPRPERNQNDSRRQDRPSSPSRGHQIPTETIQPRSGSVSVGAGRTRIVRQSGTPAPERHDTIARNRTIISNIERNRRVEVVPNRRYWHNHGGVRYVHTYRGGTHWYGFYHGPRFYWTRYHRNRWWWYDDAFAHWVYWWDGRWWWNGPGGQVYVHVNDSYYPAHDAPISVATPVSSGPPPEETENNGGSWTSRDGKRMVQVHGPQAEAYLYDNTGKQPTYLAYLGKNVERVRFSGGTDEKPVRILVDFKNGDFTLFSSEGEPADLTPPEEPSDESTDDPPNPPADIPE